MPAMLRKSGLTQLKKFKDFIGKQGGDISKKLKDKTVSNTLDKHIATSDEVLKVVPDQKVFLYSQPPKI